MTSELDGDLVGGGAVRRRIVAFGTYDVRTHPRVAVLLEGLADHGHEVLSCNVPLGLDTSWRVRILRAPWLLPVLVVRLMWAWIRLLVRAAGLRRRLGGAPDAVLVGYMGHFDVHLARRLFPGVPVLLDHLISASDTARDRGVRPGLVDRMLRRLDEAAVRAADVPFVDTPEHLELLPPDVRPAAAVVPVGAPRAWFSEPNSATPTGPLRVVFFGLYTPLQGAPVLGAALGLLAAEDIDVTMIGHGQDLAAARAAAAANPRVRWLPWVDSAELPAVVAAHHICLGIFGTGPKALRVVPNKVFQGAAAGCGVVTSDTVPQRGALGDAARYVPPGDAVALAAVITALARDRAGVDDLRHAAHARALAAFSPTACVAPLLRHLGAVDRAKAICRGRPGPGTTTPGRP